MSLFRGVGVVVILFCLVEIGSRFFEMRDPSLPLLGGFSHSARKLLVSLPYLCDLLLLFSDRGFEFA